MKHLKKILALALIVMSLFAVALPAMAGKISNLSGNATSDLIHQSVNPKKYNFEYTWTMTTSKPAQKYYCELRCLGGGTLASGNYSSNGALNEIYGYYGSGSTEYWLRINPAGHAMTVEWEAMAY